VLGRFFTAIFGMFLSHARVASMLSGLFSALAVMFTYLFSVKFISMFDKVKLHNILGGVLAAAYTAFSYTFWMNSIEAEVYAGLAFFINIIVWLSLIWMERSKDYDHQNLILLIIYMFFLGFCIHQTSLQIAPAILLMFVYADIRKGIKTTRFWTIAGISAAIILLGYYIFNGIGQQVHIPDLGKYVFTLLFGITIYASLYKKFDWRFLLLTLGLVLLALTPHIYLIVRAGERPFINEGAPHTLSMFTDYVLRRQYGNTSFMVRRATLWYQFNHHFLRYFGWQFFDGDTLAAWLKIPVSVIKGFFNVFVVFGLGIYGIIDQIKKNKHSFINYFLLFFMASFAMVFIINLSDAEVRDRDYFFVTAYNFWTFWMAWGSIALIINYGKNKILKYILIAVVITLPILNMASQHKIHDRSGEFVALDYGQNFLNSLEENAIIFTNGDNDTFPLWYAQAVEDPYAKEFIRPMTMVKPDAETWAAIKSAREYKETNCFGIRKDVSVANLSLLNTPWYIRQIRDKEGILFNVPDDKIDKIVPIPIYSDKIVKIPGPSPEFSFEITIPKEQKALMIKDLAVLQIIKDNFGKRPIYFAVTCSETSGFDNNLVNVGMVDRVVPTQGKDRIDLETITENVDKVYSYRSIFEDKVYKDENSTRLINNYGAAYMRLSQYYHERQKSDLAISYLEKAMRFIKQRGQFNLSLAQMYAENGQTDKAAYYINEDLKNKPRDVDTYQNAAIIFMNEGNVELGTQYIRSMMNAIQGNDAMAKFIFNLTRQNGFFDEGVMLLNELKSLYPGVQVSHFAAQLEKEKVDFKEYQKLLEKR
jgi:tetratricopeptide (TPR) repeat protein